MVGGGSGGCFSDGGASFLSGEGAPWEGHQFWWGVFEKSPTVKEPKIGTEALKRPPRFFSLTLTFSGLRSILGDDRPRFQSPSVLLQSSSKFISFRFFYFLTL